MTDGTSGAVLVAGGLSSRMGALKPLLVLDGVPVVVRAARSFRDAGIEPVVVLGHEADRVAEVLDAQGFKHVFNAEYELGMYSSLRRGVRDLADGVQRFFVLPADCPLVRCETVGRLLRAARSRDASVIYPRHDGRRGHPPLIDAALIAPILSSQPDDGLRGILGSVDDRSFDVDVDDAGVLLDMDRRADYEQLQGLARLERVPDRETCEMLLSRRRLPAAVLQHSYAVERVAGRLAEALNGVGMGLHARLLEAASLLHDIARTECDHANRSADLVAAAGYPRLAPIVRRHMNMSGADAGDIGEAQLLFLADKLVMGGRVVSLKERLAALESRFADDPQALAAGRYRLQVAGDLERRVEAMVGRPPGAALA